MIYWKYNEIREEKNDVIITCTNQEHGNKNREGTLVIDII